MTLPIKVSISPLDKELYGSKGHVTLAKGDMETLIGNVINYDAKINENGSVECSLEFISKNAALIDRNFNAEGDRLKNKIKYSLDMEVMRFGISAFNSEIAKQLTTANWTLSADTQENYNHVFTKFTQNNLSTGSRANTPGENSALAGVYFGGSGKNQKDLYISWGFFEDKILNTEFGFGPDDLTKIQDEKSKIFEPRFDSSNTFIRYDQNLYYSQLERTNLNTKQASSRLNFLYLDNWDNTYNTKRHKVPRDRIGIEDSKYVLNDWTVEDTL